VIDQQWLDDNCFSEPGDLETELNGLAEDACHLAERECHFMQAVIEKKQALIQLPAIIRDLEAQRQSVSRVLAWTLERHDQLIAAHKLLSKEAEAKT